VSPRQRGFTLIEVLVALAIVAFGMGAVLSALSASAGNISALREKSLAQWIALNQVADARLNLQAPTAGTTTGEIRNFGNGNWHWQQDVAPIGAIPGLMQITVRVRRSTDTPPGASSSSGIVNITTGTTPSFSVVGSNVNPSAALSATSSSGLGSMFSSSSSGLSSGAATAASGSSGIFGSSSSGIKRLLKTSSSSGAGDGQVWLATVVGFRGDAIAAASGEVPDWNGTALGGGAASSSSGASSSGLVANPGNNPAASSSSSASSGAGSSSSGGN
jgi:general secretion pathway protein I